MIYYSDHGEDKYLEENGNLPEKGVFVDVGAGGIEGSNSYHFEKKGWRCLCIEPDARHEGLTNRALVDHSIVGAEEKPVNFLFHRLPNLSGLHHKVKGAILPMRKLDSVLQQYHIERIDILSIDVEGHELDVLKGFSIDHYEPSYIIIEYINQFTKNREDEIAEYLNKYGYNEVYRTSSNLILTL